MTSSDTALRQVPAGTSVPDAVTVGIERRDGELRAAVWWPSRGDVDADEAEYATVTEALAAADAARTLHGFGEVVIVLAEGVAWQPEWGSLRPARGGREPIGDIRRTGLSSDEAESLARGIEAERDA